MSQVVEDKALVLITRQKGEACVLMPLEQYNSLQETAYLLRSPANARRLIDSIENLKSDNAKDRGLIGGCRCLWLIRQQALSAQL